jgi:NitT/TauT family transport system substrate-binding protein
MVRIATVCTVLLLTAAAPGVRAADRVSVGTVGNNSDAAFFIADARGYFKEAGLDIAFTPFDGAARMIVPLSTGALDVGGGAASAGLYNAAATGIAIKIVADRSRTDKNFNFQSLMVRKELVDSGRFKSYADLKGKKVAILVPGGSPISTLNEAAKKGGVAYADIDKVYMSFPQQVTAFVNGGIDAAIMIEPFATLSAKTGAAVRFASTEAFYPRDQIGMIFYSEKFGRERRDAGMRFMKAYVRGLRDYCDAVADGRFTEDDKGKRIVGILATALKLTPAQIREAETQAVDPDGHVNEATLRNDLEFFKSVGEVTSRAVTLDQLLDNSFVEAAVKALGPYEPAP